MHAQHSAISIGQRVRVWCTDPMKAIRTELTLTRDEFNSYTVGVDAEVTFCLKEFRVRPF